MTNKLLAGSSLLLCLAGLGLTISAKYAPDWAHYETGPDSELQWGLWRLTKDQNDSDMDPDSSGISWH